MKRVLFSIPILLVFAVFLGCSGGTGVVNPITPDLSMPNLSETSGQSLAHRDLWGWWIVTVDPTTGTADVVPFRTPQLRANVTQWMQPPLGKTTNLRITVVDASTYMSDGRITVDVTLTHPFPGLDMYTGFDVHGVFMHDGTVIDGLDGSLLYTYESSQAAVLENPDGYTRWWNYTEFQGGMPILSFTPGALANLPNPSATLNPYKYFADGLGSEDDLAAFLSDPATVERRALFSAGGTNTRRYYLQFPMELGAPVLKFQYAVAASWEEPDPALSGDPDVLDMPGDFHLSANQQEPCGILVDTSDSTLYYAGPGDAGGRLVLDLEVFDWQAIDDENPEFQLAKIGVSACASCSYPVTLTYEGSALQAARVPASGTAISSVWHVEIDGIAPTASGPAPFLLSAEPADPNSYDQGYGQPVPVAPLAAYQLGWVLVGTEPSCTPPTAYAEAVTPTDITAGESVTFDASGTTGTPPFVWEWDWDSDGAYDEQTDQPIIEHVFNEMGTFEVMCKATNDCGVDEIDSPIVVNVTCGTGLPTFAEYFQGTSGLTCPYYYMDVVATVNDPETKLAAPGAFSYTSTERKVFLTLPSNPTTIVAEWEWTGTGEIGSGSGRMAVDGSSEGVDRIFFVSNTTASRPNFIDWDGSSFTNETTLPPMPYGSVRSLCVTDEGDVISHNNMGPNTTVYLWDKQNSYQVQQLFQFQNTSASIPYGSLGNIGKIAYDPATETILFPVSNGAISMGGQLYGFTLDGTRVFADTDVFGTSVGSGSRLFGVTVDLQAPSCRVLFHGAPNYSHMWIARFVNDMADKYIAEITDPLDNAGGRIGCFTENDFWTNSNNWSYRVIRRPLPADW